MSSLQERFLMALDAAGMSQADLSKRLGVTSGAVSFWCTGRSKKIDGSNGIKAAKILGVSPEWLINGSGEMHPGGSIVPMSPESSVPEDVVVIKESRAKFSAGNGHIPTWEEVEEDSKPVYYHKDFFVRMHVNPSRCRRFVICGDSMFPMIHDGDHVLVDCSEGQRIVAGRVYAFCLNGELRVKMLSTKIDGTVIIRSANPDYPIEEVPPDMWEQYATLVGRVIERSGIL